MQKSLGVVSMIGLAFLLVGCGGPSSDYRKVLEVETSGYPKGVRSAVIKAKMSLFEVLPVDVQKLAVLGLASEAVENALALAGNNAAIAYGMDYFSYSDRAKEEVGLLKETVGALLPQDAKTVKLIHQLIDEIAKVEKKGKRSFIEENRKNACISNLKQIQTAYVQALLSGVEPTWSNLCGENGYIKTKPKCPSGGNYKLPESEDGDPTCSVAGHALRH